MRILVVTHDLTQSNANLMPWRTVCELVNRLRGLGADAQLLSLGIDIGSQTVEAIPTGTQSISKDRGSLESGLKQVLAAWPCQVIIWPLVWREPRWRVKVVTGKGIPVIGYLPGGVYHFADIIYAARRIGVRLAARYMLEAISPKSLQLSLWQKNGINNFVAMTEYTAQAVRSHASEQVGVVAIPPGRDGEDEHRAISESTALPDDFLAWLDGRPYFLFAGPPSGIRGIYELLESFALVAEQNPEACLVCLFRSDAPLESERLKSEISNMKTRDRIYVIWKSVDKSMLDAFMSNSHGVVLPFVIVPSEIPLAIIEAMRFGKPILTTMTGGTGDWVSGFALSSKLGDVHAMAESMNRLLNDNDFYQKICNQTLDSYRNHPTWDEMARQWYGLINDGFTSSGS